MNRISSFSLPRMNSRISPMLLSRDGLMKKRLSSWKNMQPKRETGSAYGHVRIVLDGSGPIPMITGSTRLLVRQSTNRYQPHSRAVPCRKPEARCFWPRGDSHSAKFVLKRVTGPPELQKAIVQRESRFHPLSMSHENIIETHYLENSANEPFLVEAYLPVLLNDDWRWVASTRQQIFCLIWRALCRSYMTNV